MLEITLEAGGVVYKPDDASWVDQVEAYIREGTQLNSIEMDWLAETFIKGVKENIESETDIFGNAMLPLMPSTIARKHSSKILQDTEAMLNSMGYTGTGIEEREIFSDSPYGGFHQTGTSKMVARPWFGLSPNTDDLITQYLKNTGYLVAA
jgi:phage gpG-like protein